MLNTVFLLLVVLGLATQNVARKSFNSRTTGGAFTFSAASCLFSLLVFVISSGGEFDFSIEVLPYSVLFAAAYVTATACVYFSISFGSLALTSLIVQYSLIIPTVFGFVLWGEKISLLVIVGIILLCISLALINCNGKSKKNDEADGDAEPAFEDGFHRKRNETAPGGAQKNITPKWIIYVFLAFVGNGLCSTVQKAHQMKFDGKYESEMMICALLLSFISLFALALIKERSDIKGALKTGCIQCTVCGFANGAVNLLVLTLSLKMAASLMFPIISAGGIVATYLVSLFIYRERMTRSETAGMIIGIASIIALNL